MEKGFTLVELMIVVALISITVALAAPMGRLYTSDNATSQLNEFVAHARFARSQAITSRVPVVLCPIAEADQHTDPVECAATTNYHIGWVVFSDSDGDGTIGNGTPGTGDDDTILKFHEGLPVNYTLTSAAAQNLSFAPNGLSLASADTWTLCVPSRENEQARGAAVAISGRIMLAEDGPDADRIRETRAGNLNCP